MTGPRTQEEALTAAASHLRAAEPPGRGRVLVAGFDRAQEVCQVRHLVIFRAPVAGFARPAAAVSAGRAV